MRAKNQTNFTHRGLNALPIPPKGKRHTYFDTKVNGLNIIVTSNGTKTFYVRKSINGKSERVKQAKESFAARRAGFKRRDEKGLWEYFVFPSTFKSELCKGHSPKAIKEALISREVIITRSKEAPYSMRCPGINASRMYHFCSDVLEL